MAIKLSNQQVNALALKIKDDFEEKYILPVRKANKAIKESDAYINFFKTNKECVTITNITKDLEGSTKNYGRYICEEIREREFEKAFKTEPYIKLEKIEQEIHLATIDAVDLQSLIVLVSSTFVG